MFAPLIAAIGPAGLIALFLLLAALAAVTTFLFFRSRDTVFHPVHRGKAHHGGCKFDSAEVNRTRFAKTPDIDLSNLPAPDPRIVKAFATIKEALLLAKVNMLSGEADMTVGGKTVRIKSRSTFGTGYLTAMTWLEEFYSSIGLPTRRESYRKNGKTFYYLIATRKGDTTPEKVVIAGAHLDSTAGEQYRDEPLAPGADDDGSGTIALTELARILKDLPLACTIEFVHFTGEEQGLWASYAYSDKVAAAKVNVIAMVEMDMIGYCVKPGNRLDIHDDMNDASHELVVLMVRNIARYGLNLNPVDTHNHAVQDRSDHAGFLDHGYKAILVSEEFTDDGFNRYYHSVKERSSNMNFPYMVEVVKALLATVADLAELK